MDSSPSFVNTVNISGGDPVHPSAPDGDDEQDDNLFADLHFLADTIMDRLGLTETDSLPRVSSDSLLPLVSLFKGGGVSHFSHNWEKLTSDAHLISIVKYGVVLDFVTPPPKCSPHRLGYSEEESRLLDVEVKKLLQKRIIAPSGVSPNAFYSQVFLRDKKDGSFRFILNLKRLNKHIEKRHFKMESIRQIVSMVQPGCWMASIDLKDAYYSVPVHPDSRKYLRFVWDQAYEYACLPNGYRDAPRLFTKLLKPVFGSLRQEGLPSVVYLDDAYLQGSNYSQCKLNVLVTVRVLRALGFTIHARKSVLEPVQEITTLGFVVNSLRMTICLTEEKRTKLIVLCRTLSTTDRPTIRQVAKVVGNLVATSEAVPLAPLYFRRLEAEKAKALKRAWGDYDSHMVLSPKAQQHLAWWTANLGTVFRSLLPCPVSFTIYSDASRLGWGAVMGGQHTFGQWTDIEWNEGDINVMEITAAKFALFAFCPSIGDAAAPRHHFTVHVHMMIDNTTAVAYINRMGGTRSIRCNKIAAEMWHWAEDRGVWLTAAHIPGEHNVLADYYSRHQKDAKEWALAPTIFSRLDSLFGSPSVDLFASRTNHKLVPYASWLPDPGSLAVDAFSIPWSSFNLVYCFPPFSLLGKTLRKIREERVTAIVVAPLWPTQSWYPTLLGMLVDFPAVCGAALPNLYLPHKPLLSHPLGDKLRLVLAKVSGDTGLTRSFRTSLRTSSGRHGGTAPTSNMRVSLGNGKSFVLHGTSIPYTPL